MKESLLKIQTDREAFTVQRVAINLTTLGLYEGINDDNIRENLDFQGHPFGKAPYPIIYKGLDNVDLSETYSLWALLEASPKDSSKSISVLAFCLITNSISNPITQLEHVLPLIDYWGSCKDFDL